MAYQFAQDYKTVFKDKPYQTDAPSSDVPDSTLKVIDPYTPTPPPPVFENAKSQVADRMFKQQQEQDFATQDEISNIIQLYKSQGLNPSPEESASAQTTFQAPFEGGVQRGILGKSGVITQQFGNRNAIEKYSKGVNYGTDIAVPKGTPVALPPGEWKVIESFNGATASGSNNSQGGINRGYGNSVLVQNAQTGEKLRMSHLSQVGVQPGQVINGGSVIAKTGATGNVHGTTGEHLDLEYYTPQGQIADVLKTRYARYLMSKAGQSSNGGGGNPLQTIKNGISSFQQDYQNFMKTQQASLPNAVDRAITSPKTALEAVAPGMRDASKSTFDAIRPFNLPVGSLLHSQLFADDSERLARSQAQSGQPLTQEQKKMALSKMVDTVGSVTGAPKFHPDDVKFLNETADILGDNARKAEAPKAMKDLQTLAETYLTPDEAVGRPQTVLKKLLNKTEPHFPELIRSGDTKFDYNTDYVARERFKLPELQKISSGGSDRDVYDLGNGKVLKVSKSARGIAQNMSEGEPYAPVPEVFEKGKNYVVAEKVNPPDANTKKMVGELKKLNLYALNSERAPGHYEEVQKVADILDKYGVDGSSVQNYNVMFGDLSSIRNWGTSADGSPIHVDAGTFNNSILDQYKGVKNLEDPDFIDAYRQSRAAKKKYGDTDKNTMYGLIPALGVGGLAASQMNNKKK